MQHLSRDGKGSRRASDQEGLGGRARGDGEQQWRAAGSRGARSHSGVSHGAARPRECQRGEQPRRSSPSDCPRKTRTQSCRIEPITARLLTSRPFAGCPDSTSSGWMPYGSEWHFATENRGWASGIPPRKAPMMSPRSSRERVCRSVQSETDTARSLRLLSQVSVPLDGPWCAPVAVPTWRPACAVALSVVQRCQFRRTHVLHAMRSEGWHASWPAFSSRRLAAGLI